MKKDRSIGGGKDKQERKKRKVWGRVGCDVGTSHMRTKIYSVHDCA